VHAGSTNAHNEDRSVCACVARPGTTPPWLPLGALSAQLQPLGGWRRGVQHMQDPNGLLDARLASLNAPA